MKEFHYIVKTVSFLIFSLLLFGCSESPKDLREKADKLYINAQDYYTRGYLKNAATLFKEIIEIEEKLKLSDKQADCYLYLGLIASENYDYKNAEIYYLQAKELFSKKFDRRGVGMVENNLGNIFASLGYINKALDYYKTALMTGQLSADKEGEAIAQMNMGSIYLENKEFKKAFDYFNRAYDNYQIIGNLDGELNAVLKVGESFFRYGALNDAMDAFKQGYDLAEEISQKGLAAEILNFMGMIYAQSGNYDDALTLLNSASLQARKNEDPGLESIVLANLGDIFALRFDYPTAIKKYSEAIEKGSNADKGVENLYQELKLAKAIYNRGIWDDNEKYIESAKEIYNNLLDIFEEIGDETGIINAECGLMICNYSLKDFKRAYSIFEVIVSKLENLSPQFRNKYTENMIVSPQIFNYDELYKVMLLDNDNKKIMTQAVKFTQYQISDLIGKLNHTEYSDSIQQKVIDSLRIYRREVELLKMELMNESAKESKFRNKEKIGNLQKNLQSKDKVIPNKLAEMIKKEYSLDKYNLPEIQKRLADRSALIAFLMLEDSLSIFIVDRNNIKKSRGLLNQSILSGQIKMMVQSIQKNDTDNLDLILKGLYQNIFASIEKNLTQYKKIYFLNLNDGVTDLNYIPLHALRNSNNIAISKRFETYYFGGMKNRTMEDNRTGSDILIFDSLTVKTKFPKLEILKCSDSNKSLLRNKRIRKLFLFSEAYINMTEPSVSYLKISQGNDTEKDIRLSDINKYSVNALYLMSNIDNNSSSMRMFSYISPYIHNVSFILFNISQTIKEEIVSELNGNVLKNTKLKTKKISGDTVLYNFVKI